MKLQKKQYILECWNCKSKIIYSHSDCNYDGRYHSYELKCPNCQQRYSTERRELFHKEYQTEDKQIDQLTNNWNELRQHIKEYLEEWENSDDEWVKGKCDMARDILYDMEEIKEGNNV